MTNTQDRVRFDITDQDRLLMRDCVDRGIAICKRLGIKVSSHYAQDFSMDLTACHANGNPIDFVKLLAFDDVNFMHDMGGISTHLDRSTGQLRNSFTPRASKREG